MRGRCAYRDRTYAAVLEREIDGEVFVCLGYARNRFATFDCGRLESDFAADDTFEVPDDD